MPGLVNAPSSANSISSSHSHDDPKALSLVNGAAVYEDECQFWSELGAKGQSQAERDIAHAAVAQLSSLRQEFLTFHLLSPFKIIQTVDAAHEMLGELVSDGFPIPRAATIARALLHSVAAYVHGSIPDPLISSTDGLPSLIEALDQDIKILERCLELSTLNGYPGCPNPPLALDPNALAVVQTVAQRLEQLLDACHCMQLLRSQASVSLDPATFLAPLSRNLLLGSNNAWTIAWEQFEYQLQPLDDHLCRFLSAQLRDNDAALIQHGAKYMSALKRPRIQDALAPILKVSINRFQTELQQIDGEARVPPESPVDRVLWVRQSLARIRELDGITSRLGPTIVPSSYHTLVARLRSTLESLEANVVADWCSEAEGRLASEVNASGGGKNNQLLVLDMADGRMHVLYSEDLGQFLRQIRVLLSLGCAVKPNLIRIAEEAEKNYKAAVSLSQIAHFYNTIDAQIYEFQRPLLLDLAVRFEALAQQQINWRDRDQVRTFIAQLSSVAAALQAQNNRFHLVHQNCLGVLLKMLRYPTVNQWKLGVQELSTTLAELGYTSAQLLPWRTHLQMQLYKVMRTNYAQSLKEFSLPEVKVDVTMKNGKIVLRPPLEELKAKYFREVRRLISMPLNLRGLIEQESYSDIVDDYAEDLLDVYRKADQVFDDLDKKLAAYADWAAIGCLTQDKLVEVVSANCITVQDWEAHFKTLKQKGKDAELLPNSFKVENLTCSVLPLKAVIDDYLQRLFDVLVAALHSSINAHAKSVQGYLNSGLSLLAKVPSSVAEIAQAKGVHDQLKTNDTQHHFAQIQVKQKLLRAVAGSAPDLSDLFAQYNQFDLMVKGHELMIQDQFDQMMGQLDARAEKIAAQLRRLHGEVEAAVAAAAGSSTAVDPAEHLQMLLDLDVQAHALQDDCRFFGVDAPTFDQLAECKALIEESLEAKKLATEFADATGKLLEVGILQVQLDEIQSLAAAWKSRLDGVKLSKATLDMHKLLDALSYLAREWGPVFGDTKRFTAQHWSEFCAVLGMPATHKVLLEHLAARVDTIQAKRKALEDLGMRARNESVIRDAVQEVEMWSVSCSLAVTGKGPQGIVLIQEFKTILSELSDQRSAVSSLQAAANAASFADVLTYWDKRLQDLDQFLRHLQIVQKKWAYLVAIISALPPAQQQKFATVDTMFREIMRHAQTDARAFPLLSLPQAAQLGTAVGYLETCQKCLLDFLEEKRNSFPRFYFIGDEDLLEILSQSATNPRVVQMHLKKLFSGLHRVIMEGESVVGIASAKGEEVMLDAPVAITNKVDEWLSCLCNEIQSTLARLLDEYLAGPCPDRAYPEQITDLAFRIGMTAKLEAAIQAGNGTDAAAVATALTALRETLDSTSYESIYYARVIEELITQRVVRLDDFRWAQLLRFYYQGGKCVIRTFDAEFAYSFEYQGNPSKLVVTPLTDTCFATLTQAMSEGLGGCLYGPAGTGKTESVKHLGYMFGRQVLVFNCDEALDVNSITRLFCGIIKCGAWGCFDEFNRLTASVLAAVSNLVSTIQNALLRKLPRVAIAGNDVAVNPCSCLFVTLNPAGKQYKGRQQLPTNLKQLFRNIAMTHPDVVYICQIELKALGFRESTEILGQVTVDFFDACKKVLSQQRHYDWGLRALKAVLMTAGDLRRRLAQRDGGAPPEHAVMAQAMRLATESKLTSSDVETFLGLVTAYFGQDGAPSGPESFLTALVESYKQANLPVVDWQMAAAIQFSSACEQRMGVCLAGPPRSGKMALVRLVVDAWTRQGKQVKLHLASPKAMRRNRLLGFMDPDTREWHDGVLTMYSRETVAAPEAHHLIVLDGDIDPEWIEALNSVLDDNRLLTMPNGERIKFEANVNFVFVADSLQFASPATVSRLAIVFLTSTFPVASESRHNLVVGSLASGRKRKLVDLGAGKGLWIQCTRETVADHVVAALLQHCSVTTGLDGCYLTPHVSPDGGLALYVCDVDLPCVDQYRSVQLHQLLHQLIQHGGFHHPKTLEWIHVRGLRVLCTATATAAMNSRLLTKFRAVQIDKPSQDAFARDALAVMRQSGIDSRLAARFSSVLGDLCARHPLGAKKCLELLLERSAAAARAPLDEAATVAFLDRAGELVAPNNGEFVRAALMSEFGSLVSSSAAAANGSELALDEAVQVDNIAGTLQFRSYYLSLMDALTGPLPVVHLQFRQGIPAVPTLVALCGRLQLLCTRIHYHRTASLQAFQTQLKEVIAATGVRGQRQLLIIEPQACPTAEYYHAIHQIFARAATDLLPDMTDAETAHQNSGHVGSLGDYVLAQCIANMRVVLVNMNPEWLPGFPLFLTRSTFLQWNDWDAASVEAICRPLAPAQAEALAAIYRDHPHSSPAHLTQVVGQAKSIHARLADRLNRRQTFLQSGMDKLKSTKSAVDQLSRDAARQARELQEKQTQADSYLKQITETMMNVSTQKTEMEQLTAQLSKEEVSIQAQKEQIQNELLNVEPLLAKAKSAVSDIKSEHLTEVRSLRAPPAAVRDVLEGVLRLLGQQDVSWAAMKSVLGKRSFKDEVLNFNARNITPATRGQVEQLMKQKPDSFVEANVRKSSVAAAPLAVWVVANLEYSKVIERVQPLQNQLNKVNASLDQSRKRIEELHQAVLSVDETVAKLKVEFAEKTGEAQKLALGLGVTNKNLDRARALLDTLLSEEQRWLLQLEEINVKLSTLDHVALCCAMYSVWCSNLPEQERQELMQRWAATLGIPAFRFSDDFAEDFAMPAIEELISRENLTMAQLNAAGTFWVADGNGLGMSSIQTVLAPKVISVLADTYVKEVEMAIRLGHTILLMDVTPNDVHPWLYPILRRDFTSSHGRVIFTLGEKQIEVHERFRIMLYTPFAGWKLPDELFGSVAQLCWSTTAEGLTSRLLRIVTSRDTPEVIGQLTELEQQEKDLRAKLIHFETQLLQDLSSSDGDILSNEKLFQSLMAAKEQGQIVSQSLAQSRELQAQLKGQQAQYSETLQRITQIYFLVRKLAEVHPHYRFSLRSFLAWYEAAIAAHPCPVDRKMQPQRMRQLLESFAKLVYLHVTTGIDAGHHVAFGLNLLLATGEATPVEVETLCGLRLGEGDGAARGGGSLPSWINETQRDAIQCLQGVVPLGTLAENETKWRQFIAREHDGAGLVSNPLHLALLTQALVPDALYSELLRLVQSRLGSAPVEPSKLVSSGQGPVLMFVHPGVNPLTLLGDVVNEQAAVVSLGQGMEAAATEAVTRAIEQGTLVFVQNLQALPTWIPTAIALLQSAKAAPASFRFILSCEVNTITLPVELVEQCSLVNVQVLPGFHRNLAQTLSALPGKSAGSIREAQLQFLVTWFHTVMQERRNFLPQAWQKYYEFGAGDFASISRLLQRDTVLLRGLTQLVYGGRIDVPVDAAKLRLLIDGILHEDVLGSNNRMPSRKLLRGFALPASDSFADFHAALDQVRGELKDHVVLQLPPNVHTTVDAIRVREAIDLTKRLMRQSAVPTTAPAGRPAARAASARTGGPVTGPVAAFLAQWKAKVAPKPAVATSKLRSPLAKLLAQQYAGMLAAVDAIQRRLALLKSSSPDADPALAEAITMSTTPEDWQSLVPQPNLMAYPRDLGKSLDSVAALQDACEKLGPALAPGTRLGDVTFAMPSPAGFLCVFQQLAAAALKVPIHSLVLVGWVSAQGPPGLAGAGVSEAPVIVVKDLWLQGAVVESGRLVPVPSPSTPSAMLVTVYLSYVPAAALGTGTKATRTLTLPVYSEVSRETQVACVAMLMEDAAHVPTLTLAGAALLTHLG
ncbi:hypothetical protein H9P43_004151 [Blastocladiella emersonii ATCC 22665]|nr:hypothetical protein H9P43_004151 [Blastocladiella emersonii ATCC 22665]